MQAAPRVSVVVGVYNTGPYLDATIASVVGQTFPDWELILVDDGSTDDSPEIIRRWVSTDPRIRTYHRPNSGRPAFARNRGIVESRGEIICFLDADDLFHPDKLRRQVEVLDAWPEVGAVFNDFRWFASGAAPEAGQLYLAKERFIERAGSFLNRRELGGHPVWVSSRDFIKFVSTDIIGIHTSSIAIRRSLIESLGSPTFREDIPHCEDIELWLRITRATQLAILETPLSFYRYRPGGWMVSNKRATLVRGSYMVKSEMLKQLEQMLSPAEWPQYRDRLSKSWFGLGYLCLVVGLVPQAREAYREALRTGTGPAHVWKAVKGLLVSVLPRPLLRAYWKARGGGEFEPRPGPPV